MDFELGDELRRVAREAAGRAWPLPVADVIRRGDRRRRRAVAWRSAGGMSVAGIAAAVIFTGAAGSAPARPAASGAARGVTTLTETTSSAAGTMTVQVKYVKPRRGKITPLSVTFSGTSKVAVKRPAEVFVFGQAVPSLPPRLQVLPGTSVATGQRPRTWIIIVVNLRPNGLHNFSGSLPRRDIREINQHGGLAVNDTALITLASKVHVSRRTIELLPLIPAGLILR